MDLSIIYVNWNSLSYLRRSIESVYRWSGAVRVEIIVVDNASPSEDISVLATEYPQVRLVRSAKNLGFAGANNLGVRRASAPYLLFLNPDTELIGPTLEPLLYHLTALPNAGIVGCKLLNEDGSVQTSSIMRFPRILNTVFQTEVCRLRWPRVWRIQALFEDREEPAEVEAISGACMLMKREVFEEVGGFCNSYFMYAEDLDLCYRVLRKGNRNYCVTAVTVLHFGGRSSTESQRQTVLKTTSDLRFCRAHYTVGYALCLRVAWAVNAAARVAVISIAGPLLRRLYAGKAAIPDGKKWRAVLKTLITRPAQG